MIEKLSKTLNTHTTKASKCSAMVLCRVDNAILPKGNPADATAFSKQPHVLPLGAIAGRLGFKRSDDPEDAR